MQQHSFALWTPCLPNRGTTSSSFYFPIAHMQSRATRQTLTCYARIKRHCFILACTRSIYTSLTTTTSLLRVLSLPPLPVHHPHPPPPPHLVIFIGHRPSATRPCTHHGCCPPVGHNCSNWCVFNVSTIPDLHSCRKPPAAVAVAGAHRSIAISLPPTLHAPAPAPLPPPHLSSLQSARSTLEAPAMAQQFHSLSLEFLP